MRIIRWGRGEQASLLLLAILIVSFYLRVWGSGFGLPAYTLYHPDEHALVERAAEILWTGDWNLHRFNYPSFYAYVQTLAYSLYFLWRAAQGLWSQVPQWVVPQYYHVGRLVTALFGTLTVLAVYLVGRQYRGRRTGLLAAALLGGCYLHIIHSHYATFDVMVGFLVSLTLLFSVLILARRQARWYLLAGLCAGLAGATKYNGAVVVLLPLLAHVLATPWGEWGWLDGKLGLMSVGFVAGFFGGNPFALNNWTDFLNGLATVLHHYGTQQPGFEGTGNWRWYVRAFLTSADALWVVGGGLGLIGLLVRQPKKGLLLAAFPAVYFVMASTFVVRFERNMVPLLPFLAVGGGWLLDTAAERLAGYWKPVRRWSAGLAVLGGVVLLALPVTAGTMFDTAISQVDLREIAGQWVQDHVAPDTKIAIEHYSIPFDYDQYHVEDVVRITEHDLAWYQTEGYGLLIVSDGVWDMLLRQPDAYAAQVTAYHDLVDGSTLLAEFVPQAPWLVTAGYPTVAIYHFAPVRIYAVAK
jgi:4-amino-4-deoxy-L-arabinose transferase-like glycosyltransferase